MNAPKPEDASGYIRWKSWDADEFGIVTAKDNAVFSHETRRAGVKLSNETLVLEIGFGNGTFAAWVKSKAACYVGTESNPELVDRAKRAGIEAYPATFDTSTIANGRSFSLIAIFDVLEHLEKEEIIAILGSSSRCLASNGRIIIRVPSGDSPYSGHLMHGDLTHKTHLGSFAFYQLATLSGLKVISIHNAAYPIFGLGLPTTIRRLFIAPARIMADAIIRSIYYAGEPAVIAPNLVAVLGLPS